MHLTPVKWNLFKSIAYAGTSENINSFINHTEEDLSKSLVDLIKGATLSSPSNSSPFHNVLRSNISCRFWRRNDFLVKKARTPKPWVIFFQQSGMNKTSFIRLLCRDSVMSCQYLHFTHTQAPMSLQIQ